MATSYVAVPTGADVAAFLGQSGDATVTALAGEQVPLVAAMVRSYCRDQGFNTSGLVAEDLAAVITCATARLVANPEQLLSQIGGTGYQSAFAGWTLAETFVLNRYRKRSVG